MNCSPLVELMETGNQLLVLLEQRQMQAADKLVEPYLGALDGVFQHIPSGAVLDAEQRQALQQFQAIHEWVGKEKHLAEEELLQFSKAGRASDLYKLNVG